MLNGVNKFCNPNDASKVFPHYFWGANFKAGFITSDGSAPLNGLVIAVELPMIMNNIPPDWPRCR